MIPSYDIKGFKGDWNDGKALCALCDAVEPGIYPNHAELDGTNKLENCQSGLDCAFNELGVPKLIAADEMANPRVDERGMIMYIYYMRGTILFLSVIRLFWFELFISDAWKKLEAARLEAKEKEEEVWFDCEDVGARRVVAYTLSCRASSLFVKNSRRRLAAMLSDLA